MPAYKRGSGSIYRRGKTWWLSYYVKGENICESSGTRDRGEARQILQQKVGQIAEGNYLGVLADKVGFEELAEDYLNDYRINGKKTIKDAVRGVVALKRVFGGRRVQSINSAEISRYVLSRKASDLSNASVNRELSAIKRIFNLGIKNGRIFRKPNIEMLEEDNVRVGFFEWSEFEGVLDKLPDYLRAPMTFAYHTGWRVRSEVLKMKWRNIDLEKGTIRLDVGSTKNKGGRVIYMTDEVKGVLVEERKKLKQIGGLVFHHNGRPIVNYYKAWHKACREAKMVGKIPHDFRRTAVRNIVGAGVPERVAMQMTGHKTRAVFDRYHIVSDGDLKEAAAKLNSTTLLTTPKKKGN